MRETKESSYGVKNVVELPLTKYTIHDIFTYVFDAFDIKSMLAPG